jgi:hypothetical protein
MKPNLATAALQSAIAITLVAGATLFAAMPQAAAAVEKVIAPEKNPPGDIPDSQVFVDYKSSLGFVMKVPEGWSRRDRADGATFSDKYNTINLTVSDAPAKPAANSSDAHVAALSGSGRAVKVTSVKDVNLKGGPAVLLVYSENSDPNPVTNKQIRLEANRYLFFKNGKLASLDLTAPLGADNVDQWQLMADSFRWK